MARMYKWVIPVIVLGGWGYALLRLGSNSDDINEQAPLAVAVSLVAGFVIGRWWVLAVPVVIAVGLAVYSEFDTCEDCSLELGLDYVILILAICVGVVTLGLAIGVALRKGIAAGRRRGPGAGGPRA